MGIPTPTAIERLYFDFNNDTRGSSAESWAALESCRAEFSKYNPNPTRDEQNSADDTIIEYGAVERREGFIDGFKLAVKLMGEVYAAPESNQRGADT